MENIYFCENCNRKITIGLINETIESDSFIYFFCDDACKSQYTNYLIEKFNQWKDSQNKVYLLINKLETIEYAYHKIFRKEEDAIKKLESLGNAKHYYIIIPSSIE